MNVDKNVAMPKDTNRNASYSDVVRSLIRNLCQASRASGSGALVAKLLEHRKKHSLHWRAPLQKETSNNERIVYENLFKMALVGNGNAWEQLVHALLISPSSYETPWRTACDVVQFCLDYDAQNGDKGKNDSDGNRVFSEASFRSCITNIQCFLQQALVGWCEEERKHPGSQQRQQKKNVGTKTPCDWMVQLVIHVIQPLLQNSTTDRVTELEEHNSTYNNNNNNKELSWTMIPLPLIPTIVSMAKDLDASFFHSVLDHIYHKEQQIRVDRLLAWIHLSSDLCLYFRPQDWQWIQDRMEQNIAGALCLLPPAAQLSDIAQGLFALCLTSLHDCTDNIAKPKQQAYRKRLRAWQELLLDLFWMIAATADEAMFAQIESIFSSRLLSLSPNALEHWASILSIPSSTTRSTRIFPNQTNTSTRPSWIEACLWLMVLHAVKPHIETSGSTSTGASLVSHLLTRALVSTSQGRKKDHSSRKCGLRLPAAAAQVVADTGWKQLVRLTGIVACSEDSSSCQSVGECLRKLKQAFSDSRYRGRGTFTNNGNQSEWDLALTKVGQLVYSSLSLGCDNVPTNSDNSAVCRQSLERAEVWLSSANKVLSSTSAGHFVFEEKAMAVIVLVTLYSEIPCCRSSINQAVLRAFSRDSGNEKQCFTAARYYGIILSCMIQSAQNDGLIVEIERIIPILAEPLPVDLYVEIVQVLRPLAAARRLMLSNADNILNSGKLSLLFLDESNDDGDTPPVLEYQRCLYALIALTCSSKWEKTEADAWLLLSSIIVDRQVQLPFSLRCWVFTTLREQVKRGCIGRSLSLRLLRCCVSKLLDFVGPDGGGSQTLFPERAFVFRRNDLPPIIVEDLVGLVGLVLELVYLAVSDGSSLLCRDVKETTMAWHEFFLQQLKYDRSSNSFDISSAATKVHQFEDQPVLPYTVAMYFLSVMLQSLVCLPYSNKAGNTTSVETLRGMLAKQDSTCVCQGHESLQRLLMLSPQAVSATKEVSLLSDALSDLLIEYFASPRWPWSPKSVSHHDEHAVPIRMGFILAEKRKLQVDSSSSAFVPATHHDDMLRAYSALLQDQCRCLKNLLTKETAGRNLIELLNMVADTCDLARVCCDRMSTLSMSWLVELFKVYDCVVKEASAIHVISALEKGCAFNENGERNSDASSVDAFPEFRALDDIDMYVRAVRLSVARAIASSTSVVLRAVGSDKPKDDGAGGVDGWASSGNANVLLEILLSFCNDLHLGVEGESGGISSDLFQCYLECIDRAALLTARLQAAETHQIPEVSSDTLCRLGRAAESLEQVVNVVSGDKASLFKGLIGILAYSLPCLTRSLVCAGVPTKDLIGLHVLVGRRSFRLRLFADCASILAGLSKTYGYLWWREKAMESLSEDEDGGGHHGCDKNGDEKAGQLTSYRGPVGERLCFFDLPDEKIWSRAFVMAAQGFEDDFNDVISCLEQLECWSLPSTSASQAFVSLRVMEFSEYTSALSRPLDKVAPAIVDPQGVIDLTSPTYGGSGASSEMFRVCAMSLPPAVKTRFAGSVDRFLTMLNQSAKTLCKAIKPAEASEQWKDNSASLVVALSAFAGWLTAGVPDGAIDIGLAVRRWHHAERAHFEDCVSKSKSFTSEDSVLKKLPRMEQKVDEFESRLRQLSDLLKDKQEINPESDVIARMNMLLGSERETENICQMLSLKMKTLGKQKQLLEKDVGVIRKEPNRDKGKRKVTEDLERRVKKERSRLTIRSRNAVVDEWLDIDRDNEDTGGRNDAFADLEDFLVPG